MKEQLYKYLSIGLLALLLLVCFGSLITYFVVGQGSIDNVACAMDASGYVQPNYFTNNYCGNWTFDYTINNVAESDAIIIYSDDSFEFLIYGTGTLHNNQFSSGMIFKILFKTDFNNNSPKCFIFGESSNAFGGSFYCQGVGNSSLSYNSSYKGLYLPGTNTNAFLTGSYITLTNYTDGAYLYWMYFSFHTSSQFSGYVRPSYSNYGYDQGFTDGVNSASGGDISGIVDLTNVSWEVPEETTTASVQAQYDVTGTVGDFSFETLQMINYPGGSPIGDNDSTSFKPFYLVHLQQFPSIELIPYYIKPGDIITFTGGEDVTNTDLIQWLEDNNTFKSYQDGYQDGYNKGQEIGYDVGYAQGNLDTIVTLDTYLQPFGSSTFTGVINQDPTTFWWSVQPGMQPNTAVYGYLYFNISSLPIGSIVHFNFPFQKYIVKDNSNVDHEITDIRVLYDVDYYNNLLIAPRESLPSIRLQQGVGTYSFNVIRPGDTIILYFPLNMVTDFNRYTFGLTWEGDEYNYSFTTSSISQDIKTQLDHAYERGLIDGNSQGYTNGYTVGYNEGADGAEHYTFNNLLGAVFDAPITMFLGKYNPNTKMREGGLFNFELLGVNLSGFVIALLSIGVVLFILRLFIRGL